MKTTNKISVEKVNELEFSTQKTGEYLYGFTAKISVKVNNLVSEIELYESKDYNSESGKTETTIKMELSKELKMLAEAGIDIDYSEILTEYKGKVIMAKLINENLKKEKKIEKYKNSWIHKFQETIKEDTEIICTKATLEEYLENQMRSIKIRYKGIETSVDYENVGSFYTSSFKYVLSNRLTNYNRRNYAKSESLVKTFKKLVNENIENEKSELKSKKNRETQQKEIIKKLSIFGEIKSNEDYHRSYNRGGSGYYTTSYSLTLKKREVRININNDGTFNFAGLSDLTSDQVFKIIEVIK